MAAIHPYLNFKGNCKEAFEYYAKELGGKILSMMPFEGSPMESHCSPADKKNIMHAAIDIQGSIVFGSDPPPERYQAPQGISISLNTEDVAEAEKLFKSLAEGGHTIMPLSETFWAARFGMTVDKFGIPWMVNCEAGKAKG